MDTKQFIEKAKQIHGDKYDYSITVYNSSYEYLEIICPTHGAFRQVAHYHLNRCGCPECNSFNKNQGIDKFIKRAKVIHGDKYDYSKADYINADTKLVIICPEHGEFEQTPSKHLIGGCRLCGVKKRVRESTMTQNQFIEKAKLIHGDKYDYSLVNFKNTMTPVIITCNIHGPWNQLPINTFAGKGCPKCSGNVPWTTEEAVKNAKAVHGDRFDYSKFEYKGSHKKSIIICPTHGEFEQSPRGHINQHQGCPSCNESHGEKVIAKWLDEHGIKYKRQKRWSDCKYKNVLPFDFYLPETNQCIEYDGEQHFEIKEFWGGQESFDLIKLKDGIKTDYCLKKNIPLVRITYKDNIEERLKTLFD